MDSLWGGMERQIEAFLLGLCGRTLKFYKVRKWSPERNWKEMGKDVTLKKLKFHATGPEGGGEAEKKYRKSRKSAR